MKTKNKRGDWVVETICPHCSHSGEMTVVTEGIGEFPADTVDIYH